MKRKQITCTVVWTLILVLLNATMIPAFARSPKLQGEQDSQEEKKLSEKQDKMDKKPGGRSAC